MRTLDTRSINTFTTSTMMFVGARASFLSLLLRNIYISIETFKISNLILKMEKVIVMNENTIDIVRHVTNSPMVSILEKISGRL